ncbi:hypothetical protein A0H81_04609 [Grifola frondosa]|uniref:Tetraspanin n=1 Tax=Grifola frondosa TaxID=5627 RepID=A0A1C7ME71_GRIFR|nr:hypothetical protein A0H81_04609 [Grifola frondosa]
MLPLVAHALDGVEEVEARLEKFTVDSWECCYFGVDRRPSIFLVLQPPLSRPLSLEEFQLGHISKQLELTRRTARSVVAFRKQSLHLVAGVMLIAISEVWRAPNLMLNFTLSNADLTAGLGLGIAFLITFVLSIGAVVQRNHVTFGFVILNWVLILDAIGVLIVGLFIWFFTLQERNHYFQVFKAQTPETIIKLQDKLQCCGYFLNNDTVEIGGNFCANQTFVDSLVNPNDTSAFRCVTPITAFTDATLNQIFTTIFGFMAVVICLFLASLCVIKTRQEEERFKKIDAKRGGRGFV